MGEIKPDLNHARRFPRGAPDGDMLDLEDDQLQDHHHSISDPENHHSVTDPGNDHSYGNCNRAFYNHLVKSRDTVRTKTGNSINSKSSGVSVTRVTSSYH